VYTIVSDIEQIREQECSIYTKPLAGTDQAEATLCVESILRWGNDVVQVRFYVKADESL
jgi:hypothetical protein